MACSPISASYAFCENIKDAGAKAELRLIPLADWKDATLTVDATSKNITNIALAAGGKQAFLWECGQPSNLIASSPYRAVAGGLNGYDHTLDVKVVYKDQAARNQIMSMKYSRVVAILELNNSDALVYGGYTDDDAEPHGLGLRLTGGDEIPSDATVGGLIQFILATDPDGPAEKNLPYIVDASFDLTGLDTATL